MTELLQLAETRSLPIFFELCMIKSNLLSIGMNSKLTV